MSDMTTSGRPPVEQPPSKAPGGRSAPPADMAREKEIRELAGLLGQVVEMSRSSAIFPGHWQEIAELALEHPSVRAALAAEGAS